MRRDECFLKKGTACKTYMEKEYLDYAEKIVRRAYQAKPKHADLDFMWYLWCGRKSPLSGRNVSGENWQGGKMIPDVIWVRHKKI